MNAFDLIFCAVRRVFLFRHSSVFLGETLPLRRAADFRVWRTSPAAKSVILLSVSATFPVAYWTASRSRGWRSVCRSLYCFLNSVAATFGTLLFPSAFGLPIGVLALISGMVSPSLAIYPSPGLVVISQYKLLSFGNSLTNGTMAPPTLIKPWPGSAALT